MELKKGVKVMKFTGNLIKEKLENRLWKAFKLSKHIVPQLLRIRSA